MPPRKLEIAYEPNLRALGITDSPVKTRSERYADVEAAIRALHPYELPEIVVVCLADGYAPYFRWIADATGAT